MRKSFQLIALFAVVLLGACSGEKEKLLLNKWTRSQE